MLSDFQNTRRDFLLRGGAGFGAMALTGMMAADTRITSRPRPALPSPNAPRQPHFAPTAKRVIFLFMEGGPSHMDLFDPKPLLNELAGQTMPASFKRPITPMGETESPLLASPRKWKRHGQSGLWVSDWLPHTAGCVDDLAVIRSCWTNGINHSGGVCQMNTGQPMGGRPSLGSWVSYGLGTENANLPAFVVMTDTTATVTNGPRNWSAGFMPATYQGTKLNSGAAPIQHLNLPKGVTPGMRLRQLEMLRRLNEQHLKSREGQSELEARIRAYELAFRMQASAPQLINLSNETQRTLDLYGVQPETPNFARDCLLARRMIEKGVRFVQLSLGDWDHHANIFGSFPQLCQQLDQPVAALIQDLKQRGLLDDTLVIWGGEFGRTPVAQPQKTAPVGRDHHVHSFTMWFAGGGTRPGANVGATDDLGFHPVDRSIHIHDLQATILHLLGLDHTRLTYRFQGRDFRLTDVHGKVIRALLA